MSEMRDGKAYDITEPPDGWRPPASFSPDEKAKLRPIAETLAMLEGNALFDLQLHDGQKLYEMYLPDADALYRANGGDDGYAGQASFAQPARRPRSSPLC